MSLLLALDAGQPLVVIAGIHAGCFELFGTSRVRSVLDLKNGTIAVGWAGGLALVTAMATYVGFDPRRDARLVQPPPKEAIQLLADGKIDGLAGLSARTSELRTRKIGHADKQSLEDCPGRSISADGVTNVNFCEAHLVTGWERSRRRPTCAPSSRNGSSSLVDRLHQEPRHAVRP
jgi:hypothetical protein